VQGSAQAGSSFLTQATQIFIVEYCELIDEEEQDTCLHIRPAIMHISIPLLSADGKVEDSEK
jgi:hypothetical protein